MTAGATARRTKGGSNALIHPSAQVESGAIIGEGTRVWQFSIVKNGASIGKRCNIGAHCYVEGGVRLGDNVTVKNDVALWDGVLVEEGVFIGPNAVFTNDVYPRSPRLPEARRRYRNPAKIVKKIRIRRGATIGAGAVIRAGVNIGAYATVGLGAVVIASVPAHALVVGNPARHVGWMCRCGLPLRQGEGVRWVCAGCRAQYRECNKRLTGFKSRRQG
jgi:acetyltransferase-like isoleucine patch superfamily enzyme